MASYKIGQTRDRAPILLETGDRKNRRREKHPHAKAWNRGSGFPCCGYWEDKEGEDGDGKEKK